MDTECGRECIKTYIIMCIMYNDNHACVMRIIERNNRCTHMTVVYGYVRVHIEHTHKKCIILNLDAT